MVHDLDFMDYTIPTVDYRYEAEHQGDYVSPEFYLKKFEASYSEELEGTVKLKAGNVTVYEKDGMLWATFDLDNLQGWI